MKLIFNFIVLVLITSTASALTYDQKLEDFNQLVLEIKNEYGPLKHKEKLFNFNFDKLSAKYRGEIKQGMADTEFYYHMILFANELKDLHFGISNGSRRTAVLGFEVEYSKGKYYLSSIDRVLLPKESFNFEIGDELVKVNNKPVKKYLKNTIYKYLGLSNERSRHSFATMMLARRPEKNMPLPNGQLELSILKSGKLQPELTNVKWLVNENFEVAPQTNQAFAKYHLARKDFCNPVSRIKAPKNAIELDLPFSAFTFETDKGVVGLMKIPQYMPYSQGDDAVHKWLKNYETAIVYFEKSVDGLIIDQDYNCGGSVALVHKMVSYFTDKPFDPVLMEFRTGQQQLNTLNYHFTKYYQKGTFQYDQFKSVIDQVTQSALNNEFLTPKIPLWGFYDYAFEPMGEHQIEPSSVKFTKPVVLLINEMSASGGDMFPSFMKDLGLATLVGQQTVGAGGHVYTHPEKPFQLTHSKVRAQITRSLFYSPNGDRIEDNGVTPHYLYEMTKEDYFNGYKDYLKRAVEALNL